MPKKGKKRKAPEPIQSEITDPGTRKSARVSRLPSRLRESINSGQDAVDLPDQEEMDQIVIQQSTLEDKSTDEERFQDLADQLRQANEKIEILHHQMNKKQSLLEPQVKDSDQFDTMKDMMSTSQNRDVQPPLNPVHNTIDMASHAQDIVTNALQQLLQPSEDQNKEGENIYASYMVLGSTVDRKMKEKIWRKEYIDLSQLSNKEESPPMAISLLDSGRPSLSLKTPKSAPPSNIFQWLESFSTFSAIYLQKFPTEGPALFTYMSKIIDLSRKHQGYLWRSYDEKFRRVKNIGGFEWYEMRWELIMDSTFPLFKTQQNQPFRETPRKFQNERKFNNYEENYSRTPKGFCFTFDKTGKCQNSRQPCKFTHACSICKKGGHYRGICYQNKQVSTRTQEGENNKQQNQQTGK